MSKVEGKAPRVKNIPDWSVKARETEEGTIY